MKKAAECVKQGGLTCPILAVYHQILAIQIKDRRSRAREGAEVCERQALNA